MANGQIMIKDLMRAGQKELALDERYDYDELPTTEPVHVQAHLQLTSTGAVVNGRYEATVEEPCDRCTEPYVRHFQDRFQERYVYESLIDDYGPGDKQLGNEDFYDTLGPGGVLDMRDLVYQLIVLALSSDRVCERPNCEIIPHHA